MKIVRGYKTELDLSNAQITACLKHAGAARFTYNWGLRRYQEEYEASRKTPNAMSLHKDLNALKKCDFPWMYEVSKCAPQEALRNLEKAFQRFFENCKKKKAGKLKGEVGYPKFKSKKNGIGSFRLTGALPIFEKHIHLPRLGKLRLKEARYLPTDAKVLNATVSEKAGRWYVSLQVEEEVADPMLATGKTIGVDLGVKTLATTSEAVAYENPKALRKNLKTLARLGRWHSRQAKGSN
jgi:putative transposase